MRQLSLVSQTEDYEYNKVVVGDSTDPNLIWFVLNVSLCRGITTSVDWFALPRGLPPSPTRGHYGALVRRGSCVLDLLDLT